MPVAFAFLVAVLVLAPSDQALAKDNDSKGSNLYIVRMIDAPAVAYDGDVPGLKATRPAPGQKIDRDSNEVRQYVGYLNSRHSAAIARAGGARTYDYSYTFNGFAALMTQTQVARLRADAGVLSVEKNQAVSIDTATTPAFLGLSGPNGLWSKLGGVDSAGEDVIIGIVDTGIWPEHPSFSDRALSSSSGGQNGQWGQTYGKIAKWQGTCQTGEAFTTSNCNNKLIGARYFSAGRPANDPVRDYEFNSPRDYNGHGSHTASTAGGNNAVAPTGDASRFSSISGMAPRARIAAYKACFDIGDATANCYTADSVAAIDQAVADGVDVINFSVGGTSTNYVDAVEIAFLFAADAGVFVATSAGNSGPGASTVSHISPWLASVAAGTHSRSGIATVTLVGGPTLTGSSLTAGVGPAPLIKSSTAGIAGATAAEARLCFNGKLDPAKVTGKIVQCDRGVNARTDKSLAVKSAGGLGMILTNTSALGTNADLHFVPTVHLEVTDRDTVLSYIDTAASPRATLSAGIVTTVPAPAAANFSSRGPSRAGGGDLLKPDFMAPGVDILAAVAPPGNHDRLFDLYSGTSMSSPHVAGVAALLRQAHRDWSPAAIRSALATTASTSVVIGDASPFTVGSGQIQPTKAVDPGLVYDAGFFDYLAFLKGQGLCCASIASLPALDASDLNQPSIAIGDLAGSQTVHRTVTNVGASAATYTATISTPAGFTVAVNPTTLTIAKGASRTFDMTITRTTASLSTYGFGSLKWSDGAHAVVSPIVVRPVALAAPAEVTGSGTSGSRTFTIKSGYTGSMNYAERGLVPATNSALTVSDDPTDNFDIASPEANAGTVTGDVAVPVGSTLLRFATFDRYTDGHDDLDLYVYRVLDDGSLAFAGGSGGSTAEEQVTIALNATTAARYRVYVHGFNTDGPNATFTLFTWVVNGKATPSNLTATGPSAVTIGATASVTATWTGLTAGTKYLGWINYSDGTSSVGRTIVSINTD
ncbi:MAG: S8 family serine peptidase [Chloroflexota bacterium]|nr:S8 family serine peptidase [Chloroflexota bacterium]